ncbi:MAG: hypothetical protein ACOYL8_01485 [Patescibacteria group bacterium]
MKKVFYFFALLIMATFLSCESAINEPTITKENIKIFMSYATPQQNGRMNAKGSNSETTSRPITPGDTVDVSDLKKVNIILSSENEQGFGQEGFWLIIPMDLEIKAKDAYIANPPVYASEGELIAVKLSMLGLYKATFRQKNGLAEISFYIRHTGLPGDIGDGFDNDYIFRLEKNVFQTAETVGNYLKKGYSLYIKSPEGEFDFINDGKGPGDLHALVFGENQTFVTSNGFHVSAANFKLERCKYSKDYLKLTFFSEDIRPTKGIYEIVYYAGNYGDNWFSFDSVNRSNWNVSYTIAFKTF